MSCIRRADVRPTSFAIAALSLLALSLICSCGASSLVQAAPSPPHTPAPSGVIATAAATALPPPTLPEFAMRTVALLASGTATGTATGTSTQSATGTLSAPATGTSTPHPEATPAAVLQVHFIDVGEGDSILIVAPDGKTALIDGGEPGSGVVPYLEALGLKRLDMVVATHPHSDHVGGLVEVLSTLPVSTVVTNGEAETTTVYEDFLNAIANSKANYVEAKRGDRLSLGSLDFDVLNPSEVLSSDLNNNSLVLRMSYGKTTFLFTGDAGTEAESSMLGAGLNLQANILKVGHHGSLSASSLPFLERVRPEVAVYFAGRGNPYGDPNPQTLDKLASVGATVYGTDVNGTVVVTADADGYTVGVSKQGPIGAPSVTLAVVPALSSPSPTVAGPLSLTVLSVSSPVAPGGTATLSALTSPGAHCTITVYYKSGPSKATGLSPKDADGAGRVSWTWTVGRNTTPGNWRIVVTASLSGAAAQAETTFEVAK